MSEVSTKASDITRSTIKAAIEAAIERQGSDWEQAFKGQKVVGQLVELEGRKMLVLDTTHVVDLSVSPEEAPEAGDEFTVEVPDTSALKLVTNRSFKERLEAMVKFGDEYTRRMGVARVLSGLVLSGEEEAFDGFSEDATMTDVVLYWANKLNFERSDIQNMGMLQMMGILQLPFDVRELTAVEDRVAAQ